MNQIDSLLKFTLAPITYKYGIANLSKHIQNKKDMFLQWFVGFTDAEGHFIISTNSKGYVTFRFIIRLHVDDLYVLQKINNNLNIGVVRVEGNSSVFVVTDLNSIRDVLLPIFDKYPLLTTKTLDLSDFKKAIEIKLNSPTPKLNNTDLTNISTIKNGMNLGRTKISANEYNTIIKNVNINPFWLLGFVEGEGTFGIKNLAPYFQIAQNSKNKAILDIINTYLGSIPKGISTTKSTALPLLTVNFNTKTNVFSYIINNIDVLFDYIIPFFQGLEFQTRKFKDFELWSVAVKLHKFGYFYESNGRKLLMSIASSINKHRYSTNPKGPAKTPTQEEIAKVLSLEPPFDINSGESHFTLSRKYTIKKGGRLGFPVYVYKEGVKFEGSPFPTYGAAHQAIGLLANSRVVGRYINTGKLYKNMYLFTTTPVDE